MNHQYNYVKENIHNNVYCVYTIKLLTIKFINSREQRENLKINHEEIKYEQNIKDKNQITL